MAKKVSQGQSVNVSPFVSGEQTINSTIDMLDAWKRKALGAGGQGSSGLPMTTDQVKVQNWTGAHRDRGDVIQLGSFVLTALDNDEVYPHHLWFEGNETESPLGTIAILNQPARHDAIAPDIVSAAVSGVAIAKVNVISFSHIFAYPQAGQFVLRSGDDGPFRMLSPVTGLGEQLVAVLFGHEQLALLRLESDLCRGGSATARIVSSATMLTRAGGTVDVTDPIYAAFCKGTAAAAGNTGGDAQGQANLIWGRAIADGYAFVNGGTYYRYIEGTLAAGQISHPWRANVGSISGYDGEFLYGIQAGVSGGSDYITLSGTPCGSPMDGLAFGAVAHDCGAYRVIWMCCA